MKVLFLPEVVDQFLELAEILYDKGYLGFKDAALDYSEQLFRDIQTNLPIKYGKELRRILNATVQNCSSPRSHATSTRPGTYSTASMPLTERRPIWSVTSPITTS